MDRRCDWTRTRCVGEAWSGAFTSRLTLQVISSQDVCLINATLSPIRYGKMSRTQMVRVV